jgi:site-specific recombinase XerD
MPTYTKSDVEFIIRPQHINAILRKRLPKRDKMFLILLYWTGARPNEITGDRYRGKIGMTRGDIHIDTIGKEVHLYVPLSKKKKGIVTVKKRHLILQYEEGDLCVQLMQGFLNACDRDGVNPDVQLFSHSRKTNNNIVERAGDFIGVKLCPYTFRHSRLTQLAEQGAGIDTLLRFKGSRDIKSIQMYLHAKEVKFTA